ncbi:MAG: hypothetical protein IJD48_01975 [Clostridia bacterium]|nr:hypothetical protein [Clostridia bacterium]
MAQRFGQTVSDVRKFLYTKFYGMNEQNTITSEELLAKTANISMEHREINGGKTQGYATTVTVLDPENRQYTSSTNNETSASGKEKSPVEKFNEQNMISGNSSFFITIPGTELPEEVYSLTAAQAQLQYAQRLGVKFFTQVDKDGVVHYYRAGKFEVKVDKKFGKVGKSIYEKLSWPKGITADDLGKQRPILVNRDVRENMPEGIYGTLKLARTHPKFVPIIAALTAGLLSVSMLIGNPGQDIKNNSFPQDIPAHVQVETKEENPFVDTPIVNKQDSVTEDNNKQDGVAEDKNKQDGVALGNVFKLKEGVNAFYTAKEAMTGQNDKGNGVAVIGNKYCSTEDNYYIDGMAILDKDGNVIDTNFKTYGLTREDYIKAVAEEKGVDPKDLTGIVHYSKVGEGVSLDENGNMVYDGSSNIGWVNQSVVTDGENTYLEGAEIQGNLASLNLLKNLQNQNEQTSEYDSAPEQ